MRRVSESSGPSCHRKRYRLSHKIFVGRVIFLSCLCATAALLWYLAHRFHTESEKDLAETHFESIAVRALDAAVGITLRKRMGTASMASIAAYQFPNAEAWPYVKIDGYETISSSLIETSSGREISTGREGRDMAFSPLVTPEQLSSFEEFAYDYYEERFPGGTAGLSPFGKGVAANPPNTGKGDIRFRETDGSTYYNSPNKIFAPIFQHNLGAFRGLMVNLHFPENFGKVIDGMIACVTTNDEECGSIASISDVQIFRGLVGVGPGALIMQGIYPANNSTTLVGLIGSSIVWTEVLEDVFVDLVSGIDCVLETETQVYTYSVVNGVATTWVDGDLHDRRFDRYRQTTSLTGTGLFSSSSASYTLTLYPNKDLFEVYSTDNPRVAAVGSVCIFIFTSILFILYDFFVRQELNEKRSVLEAKRKFVKFVSHEVRTPLNAVCMGLRLLEEELRARTWPDSSHSTEEETKRKRVPSDSEGEILILAEEILRNANGAVDVLNDLLNYDKVETGTLSLELTIIPIWDLIKRTMAEFKLPAKAKKIDLKLDCSALFEMDEESVSAMHLPQDVIESKVLGDTIRITQVLRNLVSNAVKFTPEGGKVTVRASWVRPLVSHEDQSRIFDNFTLSTGDHVRYAQRGRLQVTVTDTGAGLSEDQLGQLFVDGVQFNVNLLQAGQGSGLGLYIAMGIVEQHQGTLMAASEGLGHGTTFTVTLPMYHVPDSALPSSLAHLQKHIPTKAEEVSSQNGAMSTLRDGPLRILVVDDAHMNRKILTRLLQRRGHDCDQAEDGHEAVQKVTDALKDGTPYDTILMDYEMPVMNGPTASKEIRALGCDTCIVGITGNVLPEDIDHFRRCGANAVFPKPFQIEALEEIWVEFGVTSRA